MTQGAQEGSGVADLIITRRERRGWNQYELAKRARITQGHLWKIENGEYKLPSRKTRDKLGPLLGLSEEDWFRAAGVLPGEPGETAEPAPRQLSFDDPDEAFDPAAIVAYVESRPGIGFQQRLKAQRDRLSQPDYERFCIGLFRAWSSNSHLALTAIEFSEQAR